MNDLVRDAVLAERRIRTWVRETPLEFSHALSARSGAEVHLKLENFQRTGSFKVRGALNKLASLSFEQRTRPITTASSGNHGMATAFGLGVMQLPGVVYVPEVAVPTKIAAIRGYGAEVRVFGSDCGLTEAEARRAAAEAGGTYISPYNDPAIIAGQATVGVELFRQLESFDGLFIAVGGGGLLSGTAGYLAGVGREVEVVACSPANSCVMHCSLEVGHVVTQPSQPTLSDGTAGGIEEDCITFEMCRTLVDDSVLVSEDEIAAAMRLIIAEHHMLIEGAAGVAVAGFLKRAERFRGKRVVLVLCGANVAPETLREVL